MRRVLVALLAAACSSRGGPLPRIESFSVDEANPDVGVPITFTFSVAGATRGIAIYPAPGPVKESPVIVIPDGSATYTLVASNENGSASRGVPIVVRGLTISAADAIPSQIAPGEETRLQWTTASASRATLTDGATGAVIEVPVSGSQIVRPPATTAYTLTAYNAPGKLPATITATITARVLSPPSAVSFTATPSAITQGDASTLSWSGDAPGYSVSDGTTSFALGPRRSLVVRPSTTATYTLHATGARGDFVHPPTVTLEVAAHPGSALTYAPPAAGELQLVAEPCAEPCTSLRLALRAAAPLQLRGVALDLPLDFTKVTFDPTTFAAAGAFANAVAKAAPGSGPLSGTLVVGLSLPGTGSSPAADVALAPGDELAHFSLALNPAGGGGLVFDGSALAASPAPSYKATIQRASGRTANAIAVGRLEAQ